jgi:outer membrane protein TolC
VYGAGATATQNLFAGFQDVARVEQASANAQLAQTDLTLVRARLSRDLKFAYASLRYVQEAVTLTDAIARRTGENLRLVQLRFEGGRENKGSLLLTQATLRQAQFDNLQARQAIPSAQAQLARALGRATPEGLRALDDVPVSAPPPNPDFATLAAAVPEYRRAQAQESAARADVRINRSGFYPTLDVYGSYAREGSEWLADDSRRIVGATLAIPIFSGGRDYYGVEASSAALSAAAFTRGDAERAALVRLRQTYAAYVEAIERVQVDEAFLVAATTRADIARSKYASGLMSFEDWDRIENDLIQRQKNLLLSGRDRVTAEANWEQTQGIGVLP